MNSTTANIPSMSAGRAVNVLSEAYTSLIKNHLPLQSMPSVMLWGPPGTGKSQAVRQIAENIREKTGKNVKVTDVRLLLFNPIDLRGIPTANEDKTLAIWLKPKIFQMDASENLINILFLDEISAAPQSVQAAAYQITLDRVIGEHRLPDNCIVIAAGNRVTDKSVAYKMPKALSNRLMHIEIETDYDAWREWAVKNGIHAKVIGFLGFRRKHLMTFNTSDEDLAFSTPRSWEMVSNILNSVSDDITEMFELISGLIGTGNAIEFRNWDRICTKLPSVEDIFDGKNVAVPKGTDELYALSSSIVDYARTHCNDMKMIAASISYADRMPPDFSVLIMKDYLYLDKDYRKKLMKLPEFKKWLSSKGGILNGIV